MTDQSETGTPELVVPVYIDVNVLLDLLASREDGFSLVEQVTSQTAEATQAETSVSGGFGVSGVLSLLKIDAGASRRKGSAEGKGAEVKTERFHTYGSLLKSAPPELGGRGVGPSRQRCGE